MRYPSLRLIGYEGLLLSEPDFAARVYIVTPSDLSDVVISKLLELGAVEVSTVKKSDLLKDASPLASRLEKYFRLVEEAELVASKFAEYLEESIEVEVVETVDPLRAQEVLEKLVQRLRRALAEFESISKVESYLKRRLFELRLLESLAKSLRKKYGRGDVSLLEYKGELYNVSSFYGSPEAIERLASKSFMILTKVEVEGVVATSLLFSTEIQEVPQEANKIEIIKEAPRASLDEIINWTESEIEKAEAKLRELSARKRKVLEENLKDYSLLVALLEAESSRAKVLKQALSSHFFTVVSGLAPSSLCPNLRDLFRGSLVYGFCEPEENPPSELRNLNPFKPFEQITRFIGAPSLADWDPTPLLAYAFTTLFGLMIGDVGYGLLFLALALIAPRLAKLGLESVAVERLRPLIATCGLSSIAAGLLFGSFFGDAPQKLLGLSLPKVVDPLNELTNLMLYSIALGWAWLMLSYSLGLIRAIFKLKSFTAMLSSLSMIVLLISGPHVISTFFFDRPIFPAYLKPLVYVLLTMGILGIIVSKVLDIGVIGLLLWIFDVPGLAAEVLSFLRVAALAFGTSILASLFNEFVLIGTSLFAPLGVILFVVAHTFGFIITAIGAFAHTMRLCTYEISMKFYSGSNRFLEYTKYKVPRKVSLEAKRKRL